MAPRHVVVDGSNLATEGRSMPSLAQLDQAVREFLLENPEDVVTVVVDASFGHRIDASESKVFEEAEDAGELVSPPAGAIGRGDAFLLRIADKTGATVLSNDSFQEFHGDYEWLFERGRLIGGKPVPGVGWIFTPRTPVRGPRSREAVKEAKRKTTKAEVSSAVPGLDLAAERSRNQGKGKKTVERAIAVALEEVVAPKDKPRRRRKGGSPPADPVNDPLSFITFIAAHPLGGEVVATVESFASHGAFVDCEGARCYVPLSAMGEPPPKSAREMFGKGEQVTFIVQALDPQRRGVELALPAYAKVAGAPTEETVAAEIGSEETGSEDAPDAPPPARRTRKRATPVDADAALPAPAAPAAMKKAAPRRRAAAAVAESVEPAAPLEKKAAPRRRTAQAPVPVVEVAPEVPAKKATPRRRAAAAVAQPVVPDVPAAKKAAPRRRPVPTAPVNEPAAPAAPAAPAGQKAAPRRRPAPTPVPVVEVAAAPEIPAKKRTPRRPAARPVEAAPAPVAKRSTRAPKAETPPAPEAPKAETPPAPASAPASRRRRPTGTPPPSEAPSPPAATVDAPPSRTRRRSAAKAAPIAVADPAPAAPAAPAKRTRAKKTASP